MLIVNYGGGVDSTAILIRFAKEGIIPDRIIFADVGEAEKPETYAYVAMFSKWLEARGMPAITLVERYGVGLADKPIVRKQATTTYNTLEEPAGRTRRCRRWPSGSRCTAARSTGRPRPSMAS